MERKMIDWKAFVKENELSFEQFTKEIFSTAAALGAMELDKRRFKGGEVAYAFRDNVGNVSVTIRRV